MVLAGHTSKRSVRRRGIARPPVDAYPPVVYERIAAGERWDAGYTGTVALVATVTAAGAILWEWPLPPALLCGSLFLMRIIAAVIDRLRPDAEEALPRVVPYFLEPPSGDPDKHPFRPDDPSTDTFGSGYAIARNATHLDERAVGSGVKPLSAFGFDDEFYGQRAEWFPAEEGLRTVERLMRSVREDPKGLADPDLLLAELQRLRNRLQEALAQKIPFCLHVRMDAAYTAHEFSSRKGHY